MLDHPAVRKLSFTGSTEVGRTLLAEAADTVVNCSMELGGNAPFLVLDDADLDAGDRRGHGGQDAQRRRGVHLREPVLRALLDRRRVLPAADRADGRPHRRDPREESGAELGPLVNADSRDKVDRAGLRHPRPRRPRTRRRIGRRRCRLLLPADGAGRTSTRMRRCCTRRSSARSPRSSPSIPTRRRSRWPTTPNTAWSPTCTPRPGRGLAVGQRLEAGMVGLNRGVVSDPSRPVRRGQAERPRPRGRSRGRARVHRIPVHRTELVSRHDGRRYGG